jgi:hypothetical protein
VYFSKSTKPETFKYEISMITNTVQYAYILYIPCEPGQLSQYSDGLWEGWLRSDSWHRQEIFLLPKVLIPVLGAHPASYVMGAGGLFPCGLSSQGVKLTTLLNLMP